MTNCSVRECFDCGAHWPEDVMKQGKDENWYCSECFYEPEEDKPDCMAVAHAYREERDL